MSASIGCKDVTPGRKAQRPPCFCLPYANMTLVSKSREKRTIEIWYHRLSIHFFGLEEIITDKRKKIISILIIGGYYFLIFKMNEKKIEIKKHERRRSRGYA